MQMMNTFQCVGPCRTHSNQQSVNMCGNEYKCQVDWNFLDTEGGLSLCTLPHNYIRKDQYELS